MPNIKPIVVIVESPAKCSKIEGFLGPGYKVIASFGHITTLKGLKDIDVGNNYTPSYSVIDTKKTHISKLRQAISNSSKVIIATDDDREGEAIGYHICNLFNLPLETTPRIIFNEITKPAITAAINNPTVLNLDLINAAIARQVLDILVGFSVSPVLWKKVARNSKNGLSAGRCQSPALRLVYENQKDIDKSPGTFIYKTIGYFTKYTVPFTLNYEYATVDGTEGATEGGDDMEHFLEESINFNHVFDGGKPKITTKSPPQPFTTSTLQQSANTNLRVTPKNTMSICQRLYECGLITYMRTDSKTYSREFISAAKKYITGEYGEEYINTNVDSLGVRQNDTKKSTTKKGTTKKSTAKKGTTKKDNAKAQEAHEAIRPTDITRIDLDANFDVKEVKMYKLIWKNSVESCMSPAKYNALTSTITAPSSHKYKYSCEQVVFPGWKIVGGYEKENKIYNYLLSLKSQTVSYSKITATVSIKNTKSHYTEAKLVQLLEENGIGRPSTFSSLIDKIQTRGYIKKDSVSGKNKTCYEWELVDNELVQIEVEKTFGGEKNKLIIQPLGVLVMDFLIDQYNDLFNYEYTKKMEEDLDIIAAGEYRWYDLCKKCHASIKACSGSVPDINKQQYRIDDKHTWLVGKYGPVIKCEEEGNTTWKKAKDDIDLNKLQAGNYKLEDILDNSDYRGRDLGNYEGKMMYLKRGKYGAYVEWGKNKKSLSYLKKSEEEITLDDVITYINKPGASVLRVLSDDLSIRNGKYGPYIFYKTKQMRKPQFLKLKGYNLEEGDDYETCEGDDLIKWIEETHNI